MFAFIKNLFQPKLINAALARQKIANDATGYYWLYAAPVHLMLQRDTFSLADSLSLTYEESDALTITLHRHFEADTGANKVQFFWHENQWFLRLNSNPNITTTVPMVALNKDINANLPTGDGALQWAALTNEIQMLLFEHPVNRAREAKGLPVINSLWCYGGGMLLEKNHAS